MITVAQLVALLTLPKPVRPESSCIPYAPTNGVLKPDIAFLNRFVPISVYDTPGVIVQGTYSHLDPEQIAPRKAAQSKVELYLQPRRVPTAILFVVSEIRGPTPVVTAKVGTKRRFDKGPGAGTHTPTLPRADPNRTFGFSRKLSFSSPWIPEARYELREERPSGLVTSFDDSKRGSKRAKSAASRVTACRNELDREDEEVDQKQWRQGVEEYEKEEEEEDEVGEEEGDHVTMGNGKGRANGERPWD